MSQSSFPDREKRLQDFVATQNVIQDYPLLKSIALPDALVDQLKYSVAQFLVDTLQIFYKRPFSNTSNLLSEYRNELLGLPNITPNGLFLPKQETCLSFNSVHNKAVQLIDYLGIHAKVEKFHLPISLRLVNGAEHQTDQRPRASTKWHLDIWAGEPTRAYMVFVPIMGDTQNNGIAFCEPKAIPERLLRALNDYNDGAEIISEATAYDAYFKPREMYFVDPFLLHQTRKTSDELRLSLEFRVLPKASAESDLPPAEHRKDNYVDYSLWKDIGQRKLCMVDAALQAYEGQDNVQNAYATAYRTIDLE